MTKTPLLALVICASLLPPNAAHAQRSTTPIDVAYSRESRAAIGAHHICSGLWVVGRVYKRSPSEIVAQDIAPFTLWGWERDFTYDVDSARQTVTVHVPGVPARTAKFNGDQGCAIMPRGESEI